MADNYRSSRYGGARRRMTLRRRLLSACAVFPALAAFNAASANDPLFVNRTEQAGVSATHQPHFALLSGTFTYGPFTGGGVVGDFDHSGAQDILFLTGGVAPDRLFMNNGDGTFTDQAEAWGISSPHIGISACAGDYNNDGHLDIYVTSLGTNHLLIGQHRLYRNNGNGSFTNVAVEAGVNRTSTNIPDGFGCAFGDYNLDGHLDLHVTGWVLQGNGNRLFQNNGDGTFSDVTIPAGVWDQAVFGFATRFADMDGDGWPELLIAGDFGTSRYYRNNRDGTFSNVTTSSGTGFIGNGMGQAVGDFDNDGLFDWYVTAIWSDTPNLPPGIFSTGNMLFMNDGGHSFTEKSILAGVNHGWWGWGAVAVDVNNDGWLDLAETNGWHKSEWTNRPSRLFVNQGNGRFEERAAASGFSHFGMGRGLIHFDYDMDGRQDLLLYSFDQPPRLFRNETEPSSANWLRIELDTSANPHLAPNGYGAVISAFTADLSMHRQITGGNDYLTQSELAAHFGLASADAVDELTICWPNGVSTSLTDVAANQHLTIAAGPPGDLTGDGGVNVFDLLELLAQWGACSGLCPADINRNGEVDVFDLLDLLSSWG